MINKKIGELVIRLHPTDTLITIRIRHLFRPQEVLFLDLYRRKHSCAKQDFRQDHLLS